MGDWPFHLAKARRCSFTVRRSSSSSGVTFWRGSRNASASALELGDAMFGLHLDAHLQARAMAACRTTQGFAPMGARRAVARAVGQGLAGSGTIFTPASFSTRWNSGDASMILPAAARSRSTASSGSTKLVGCWFR